MRFIERAVSLGGDRVSSARVDQNGGAGFIIASGDALIYKRYPRVANNPFLPAKRR